MADDETLRARPDTVLGELKISLRTFGATTLPAAVPHRDFVARVDLDRDLAFDPNGLVEAVESNFGHKCNRFYQFPLKTPKVKYIVVDGVRREAPGRATQGDGTCFNSAIESRVNVARDPAIDPALLAFIKETKKKAWLKPYSVRYFPKSGDLQVSGSKSPNKEDALAIAQRWVDFLTRQGLVGAVGDGLLGDGEEGEPGAPRVATVTRVRTNMINHKFALNFSAAPKRLLLRLGAIAATLDEIAARGEASTFGGATLEQIREVSPPNEGRARTIFRFFIEGETHDNNMRVTIYPTGKINISGAKNEKTAAVVYQYLEGFFSEHWDDFVVLRLLPDPSSSDEESEDEAVAGGGAKGAPESPARPAALKKERVAGEDDLPDDVLPDEDLPDLPDLPDEDDLPDLPDPPDEDDDLPGLPDEFEDL